MNCKIQVFEVVNLPEQLFREICVTVDKDGVKIELSTGSEQEPTLRNDEFNTLMFWDEIDNVVLLTNRFEFETVKVFVKLVEALSAVHANRARYEGLLCKD